jgi:hypothetical protein
VDGVQHGAAATLPAYDRAASRDVSAVPGSDAGVNAGREREIVQRYPTGQRAGNRAGELSDELAGAWIVRTVTVSGAAINAGPFATYADAQRHANWLIRDSRHGRHFVEYVNPAHS